MTAIRVIRDYETARMSASDHGYRVVCDCGFVSAWYDRKRQARGALSAHRCTLGGSITVTCPLCGAPPEKACNITKGAVPFGYPYIHPARAKATRR